MNKQICNVVCPILFGNRLNAETVEIKQVFGTAFYIGNKLFLTAGHCLSKLEEGQFLGVGYPQPPKTQLELRAVQVSDHLQAILGCLLREVWTTHISRGGKTHCAVCQPITLT